MIGSSRLSCLGFLGFELNQKKNLSTKLGAINTELSGNVVARFSVVIFSILRKFFSREDQEINVSEYLHK